MKTAKRRSTVPWESATCSLGSPQGGARQTQRRFPFQPPGCQAERVLPNASLTAQLVKNPPAMQEIPVRFLGWKIHCRRERLPTPVFWPGEFHGLYSPRGRKESDTTERLSFSLLPLCPRCYLNSPGYLLLQAGSEGSPSREHPSTRRTLLFFPCEHSPALGAPFVPDLPSADTKAKGHGSPFCPPPPALSPGSGFLPPQSHTESVCLPHLRASSNCHRGQPRSLVAHRAQNTFLRSGPPKQQPSTLLITPRPPGRETHPPSGATPGLKEKMGPEVWKVSGPRSDSWVCPKPLINNSVSVLCFLHEKQRTSLLDLWFDLQHLNSLIWIHGRNISFPLGAQGESESHRVPDLQKLAGREGECR